MIEQALRDGKRVAVPYCIEGTRQMDFYYIRSMADLVPRTFGVLEPLPEQCQKWTGAPNSICLVPGLAFDRHGFRLGYGKGYYDRFLSGYTGLKIGVVYEGCLCQRLPHGYYDLPVDLLITEKRAEKAAAFAAQTETSIKITRFAENMAFGWEKPIGTDAFRFGRAKGRIQ